MLPYLSINTRTRNLHVRPDHENSHLNMNTSQDAGIIPQQKATPFTNRYCKETIAFHWKYRWKLEGSNPPLLKGVRERVLEQAATVLLYGSNLTHLHKVRSHLLREE